MLNDSLAYGTHMHVEIMLQLTVNASVVLQLGLELGFELIKQKRVRVERVSITQG